MWVLPGAGLAEPRSLLAETLVVGGSVVSVGLNRARKRKVEGSEHTRSKPEPNAVLPTQPPRCRMAAGRAGGSRARCERSGAGWGNAPSPCWGPARGYLIPGCSACVSDQLMTQHASRRYHLVLLLGLLLFSWLSAGMAVGGVGRASRLLSLEAKLKGGKSLSKERFLGS